MIEAVELFKAVRIFCPAEARAIGLTANHVTALRVIPAFGGEDLIQRLIQELPSYTEAAEDANIDEDHTRLMWWKRQIGLPAWKEAVKIVFALLPSSAPAERVFSLVEASVSSRQPCSLACRSLGSIINAAV